MGLAATLGNGDEMFHSDAKRSKRCGGGGRRVFSRFGRYRHSQEKRDVDFRRRVFEFSYAPAVTPKKALMSYRFCRRKRSRMVHVSNTMEAFI